MIKIQNVKIDEVDYAIRGNAILGIKETGKSYSATYMAERLLDAGIPIVAVDPSGVWRYLKIPRTGKNGYPVVVVGDDGDIPLDADTAGEIMHAAMEAGVSVVFDLFSKHLSKTDWRKIVKDVCETLLYENGAFGLRHVFLEEAKEYVPQMVYDKLAFSAVEKLVRIGGNSQVGITLINQRAEGLNKDVLELCASLFLFKQVGRNSITNLEKWLKKTDVANSAEITRSLFTLPKGQCWFFDEDSREPTLITIPEKNTVHPDRRRMTSMEQLHSPVDVSQFVAQMKQSLASKVTAVSSSEFSNNKGKRKDKAISRTAQALNPEAYIPKEREQELEQELARIQEQLAGMTNKLSDVTNRLHEAQELLRPQYEVLGKLFMEEIAPAEYVLGSNGNNGHWQIWLDKFGGQQKRMLELMIERKQLTRQQLRLLAGVRNVKSFGTFVGNLKRVGLIREEGDMLILLEV